LLLHFHGWRNRYDARENAREISAESDFFEINLGFAKFQRLKFRYFVEIWQFSVAISLGLGETSAPTSNFYE
jgi:hypothetical protein